MLLVLLVVLFEFARHFAISRRQDVCVSAAQLDVELTDTRRQPIIGHLLSAQLQISNSFRIRDFFPPAANFKLTNISQTQSQSGIEWIRLDLRLHTCKFFILRFDMLSLGEPHSFLFGVENTGRESAG